MDIFGILKSISSYSFWDKCLKRGSYVLGTKFFMEPIFDLGLRSENRRLKLTKNADLEFSKFDIQTYKLWQTVVSETFLK